MPIRRWGAQDKAKACADDRHIGHPIRGSHGRLIRVQVDVVEVEIDGRTFWVRPVSPDVLQGGNVVVAALAESLGKPFPWALGPRVLTWQPYPLTDYPSGLNTITLK